MVREMSSSGSRGRRRATSSSRRLSDSIDRSTQESEYEVQQRRGVHIVPPLPTNPDDRLMLSVTTDKNDFSENIVNTLTSMCLSGWPTSAITWNKQVELHRKRVWEEFEKRYKWHPIDDANIRKLFRSKANDRVKDMMSKERGIAKNKAENAYPGESPQNHMHEFNPWWCDNRIWVEMCQKWNDPKWLKISEQAVKNRVKNVPEGAKPMGTYKGGSISQSRHAQQINSSGGESISFIELYKRTREGLPKTQSIVDRYNQLMDEKYQSDVERPSREFDETLWEKASEVNNNYVKALGIKKARWEPWGRSSSSSHSSSQSNDEFDLTSAAQFVRIICANASLLVSLAKA